MKKIFLVAAMAAVVLTSVNAQNKYKPENMSFSTELNYSPGGATTDGQFSLPDYGAKVRLHLNEKMAVRLKLGLNTSTDKDVTYYESPTDQKEYERNSKESITTFSIMPGFEYHFTKYERISPYVGGEIGLLTSTAKTKTDNTENDDKTETKRPGLGFGVNVFTGVDVYLCKGLYLGFELGLGYDSMNYKRGTTTTVSGSKQTVLLLIYKADSDSMRLRRYASAGISNIRNELTPPLLRATSSIFCLTTKHRGGG